MNNIFNTPVITWDFDNFTHNGGVYIPPNDDLLALQESILSSGFNLGGERRGLFTNLETDPDTERAEQLKAVLQRVSSSVQTQIQNTTGQEFTLDSKLSAIWIETATAESNLIVHRDSEDPRIVRATFSVSPTRLLPAKVIIPIDDDQWRKSHYPMGSATLKGMEGKTISSPPGSTGIMSGTTYHRAPNPDEILDDFVSVFGPNRALKRGKILRVFGSIWGKL